ncbi:oligopeptide ABC transporter substrate-binding protein [Peribacillus asahii]|uniref:oligopeptide ABC transporter substrate-binding protein n=1 Tax=Peribacillus asahii TaxID=228899 RepID=UPI00207AB326|nr:oligopeptide ABC transporter substrate-binding protein [Peribacillus asahii]USK71426.1 oligopeptide ABC transporter substrate-binding protein [Peribacillus asahii]
MNAKGYQVLCTFISFILVAACQSGQKMEEVHQEVAGVRTSQTFLTKTTNTANALEGGHLNYGLVADSPFEGILNGVFFENAYDAEILQFFDEALLATDENSQFTQEGAATYEMSKDYKTMTITIRDGVKWHDGNPVTGEDLEFAYLTIGHPDYNGSRYDTTFQNIVGMDDYHAGKAERISGIKVAGNRVSLTFKEANPSILTGVWTYPLHKKYLGDIPVAQMSASAKIRQHPIGFGPFKVKKIVQGEAIEFEAFADYWKGKPKLGRISLSVVNSTTAVKALQAGKIDVAKISADLYEGAKKLTNVNLLGQMESTYTYIGFKLGHYDLDKKENVMGGTKLSDKRVRQAIGYAINNDEVGRFLYKGLRFQANTVIPPTQPDYYDTSLAGYTYNPEKAKKLLDEAGYVDRNGDGLREDPKGKKFVLNFASMAGGDAAEPLARYYIQQWRDVGLHVQLLEGRLHEFNSFYDRLKKDDQKIDLYQAAFGVGSDPDPSGLWARDAAFNYTRWVNEKNDELLQKGVSVEAFNNEYRAEVYKEWQALIKEEAPLIPTLFRYGFLGVNERVRDLELEAGSVHVDWSKVAVTAEKPIK